MIFFTALPLLAELFFACNSPHKTTFHQPQHSDKKITIFIDYLKKTSNIQ